MLEATQRTIAGKADGARSDDLAWRRLRRLPPFRTLLDVLIAIYACGLGVIALGGDVDWGVVSFHHAEKPILALIVLVPLRVAIAGRSWLADTCQAAARYVAGAWASVSPRIPPSIVDSLFAIITVRIVSSTAAFLANLLFEPARVRGFSMPFASEKFVEIFAAWDSGWYWDIATRGYYFRAEGQSSIAFFPLYPTLMRIVAAPFGGGAAATWVAGIAVSFVAFVAALVVVHRLAERLSGSREVARRTVLYITIFPWSIFLGRVYSESLFLLTSALAVTAAYDGRWWRSGIWGALAALTRPNGILILLPLTLLALADKPRLSQAAARAGRLALVPLALVGFCAYVYMLTGDPLAWMSAQSQWGYSLGHPPWQQLQRVIGALVTEGPYDYFLLSDLAPFELLQAATALVFLALTPLVFRQMGVAMGSYVLASLIVPLSSNALEGLGRYASVLFPTFIAMATMTTGRSHEAVVIVSLVLRTLLVCLFVNWQPVY